jgi:peptidoglycan/xylan/chitin deacetylase (PgdA/CDA1 family)
MNPSLLSTVCRAFLYAALFAASIEMPFLVEASPLPESVQFVSTNDVGSFSPLTMDGKIQTARTGQIISHCVSNDMVALTFDDGPGLNTREIVDELNRLNVKATFFVDGLEDSKAWTSKEKEDLKYTYDSDHQIASHTYSHVNLAALAEHEITQEMHAIDNAIYEVIGKRPTTMRPPYGGISQEMLRVMEQLGYYVVIWNLDIKDWQNPGDTRASINEFKNQFNESPESSFISLEHDVYSGTNAEFVREIVQFLREKGKRIVRMDECIGANAYRS